MAREFSARTHKSREKLLAHGSVLPYWVAAAFNLKVRPRARLLTFWLPLTMHRKLYRECRHGVFHNRTLDGLRSSSLKPQVSLGRGAQ